jgi:YD repeat-containing protein
MHFWNWGMALWVVIAAVELCLAWSWSVWYYRYGIPVFKHGRKLPQRLTRPPSPESFIPLLNGDLRSVRFKALSPTELAFAGEPFAYKYLGPMVMHGLVQLGPTGESVSVRGFLNWCTPAAFIPLSVLVSGSGVLAIVGLDLFYSVMLVLVYVTQVGLYKKLTAVIVEQGLAAEEGTPAVSSWILGDTASSVSVCGTHPDWATVPRETAWSPRPDGQTLTVDYDTGGRVSTLTEPRGQTSFAYHPTTGKLTGITAPDGGTLAYAYDGSLLTGVTWAGTVAGSVGWTYNTDLRFGGRSFFRFLVPQTPQLSDGHTPNLLETRTDPLNRLERSSATATATWPATERSRSARVHDKLVRLRAAPDASSPGRRLP